MVGSNGCSGGETDGGNEVNRGCGGGADGNSCESEADDDGCRGDNDGGSCRDAIEGGDIKDDADGGGCGGEIDCGGAVDGEWQHSVNWKFSFSCLKFLIVLDIFEANLAFPFSIKCKRSL